MKYWLNDGWPPLVRDPHQPEVVTYVCLQDGKRRSADGMDQNDLLLWFELQGGPSFVERHANGSRVIPRRRGRRGIVSIYRITGPLIDRGGEVEEEYDDGRKLWWRYYAEIELLDFQGFVPWQLVNQILGYAPGYTMRGFGGGSGLKEITAEQFNALQTAFRQSQPNP